MRAWPPYAVLAFVLAPELLAQQAPLLVPGQRIRISYDCPSRMSSPEALGTDCHRAVGTFVMLRGDTLTTRSRTAATVNYPLSTDWPSLFSRCPAFSSVPSSACS